MHCVCGNPRFLQIGGRWLTVYVADQQLEQFRGTMRNNNAIILGTNNTPVDENHNNSFRSHAAVRKVKPVPDLTDLWCPAL